MGMTHDRKDLRPGDLIDCPGRVDADNAIVWDFAKLTVTSPALVIGDYVKWWEKGESAWRTGRIIGVNRDGDKTWCWIQEAGRWPRVTCEASELQRTAMSKEPA